MGRTLWIGVFGNPAITSTGEKVTDLLAGHIEDTILQSATIVAIRGDLTVSMSRTPGLGFERTSLAVGLVVGPKTLDAGDFPGFADGTIAPGWMWTKRVVGTASHDGTQPVYDTNYQGDVNVKSKRKLAGRMGSSTLWMVTQVDALSTNGQLRLDCGVLLYIA